MFCSIIRSITWYNFVSNKFEKKREYSAKYFYELRYKFHLINSFKAIRKTMRFSLIKMFSSKTFYKKKTLL